MKLLPIANSNRMQDLDIVTVVRCNMIAHQRTHNIKLMVSQPAHRNTALQQLWATAIHDDGENSIYSIVIMMTVYIMVSWFSN